MTLALDTWITRLVSRFCKSQPLSQQLGIIQYSIY